MLIFCDFIQVYVFSTNHHLSSEHSVLQVRWAFKDNFEINFQFLYKTYIVTPH